MKPIFVTGVERSGISLIARVIAQSGVFFGKVNKMYEHEGIWKLINSYYQTIGVNPNGQYPLPDPEDIMISTAWREKVLGALKRDGFRGDGTFMIKDARICQTWPLWHNAFPEARWVVVRRRTGDIIQSCMKTDFMDGFHNTEYWEKVGVDKEEDAWKWWVRWHEQRFVEMITEGVDCKIVWPHRMVTGDYKQIYETLRWLGLVWKSEILEIDNVWLKSRQKDKLCEQQQLR